MENYGMTDFGFKESCIVLNASTPTLIEKAIERMEGSLSETGALVVYTGDRTGRSAQDKYIVDSPMVHNDIAWGSINRPISQKKFNYLRKEVLNYLQRDDKDLFVFAGFAGADPTYRKQFLVVNELASQCLFIKDLLIEPSEMQLEFFKPDYTVFVVPSFRVDYKRYGLNSEAAIMIDLEQKQVLICGTQYNGEIKKSIFTIMNYEMPKIGILPMHCSANMDEDTGETAVFFGLSGTGKTTLSADPERKLIGDDEHGWTNEGVFNFEGGCYAKCIDLSSEREPFIHGAIRFGSVVENVVMDPNTGIFDFANRSFTENTRVGYPVEFIPNSQIPGIGKVPTTVIFLTADAFGVLPPISLLDVNAAMYHFVTGFTSKVAGTEEGVIEPQPTFSTLFGEPFMPLKASVYAKLFGQKIRENDVKVFLVNTGWTGGPYGVGTRMNLEYTRAMVNAALSGEFNNMVFIHDDRFNLDIPAECPNVPSNILDPRNTWRNPEEYDVQANKLAQMFQDNFEAKYSDLPDEIRQAGPKMR